jgi:hypothetical protein
MILEILQLQVQITVEIQTVKSLKESILISLLELNFTFSMKPITHQAIIRIKREKNLPTYPTIIGIFLKVDQRLTLTINKFLLPSLMNTKIHLSSSLSQRTDICPLLT